MREEERCHFEYGNFLASLPRSAEEAEGRGYAVYSRSVRAFGPVASVRAIPGWTGASRRSGPYCAVTTRWSAKGGLYD
jgi:hypothetical protein